MLCQVQIALWSSLSALKSADLLWVPLIYCREASTARSVQVVAGIATAIKGSAAAGVAHRDVTPNNFGHINERGLLYDFSAGKVSAQATQICQQTLDEVLTCCSWQQHLHLTSQQ